MLDSISGAIVVPKEQSRAEVLKACHGGDYSIEQLLENNWLQRIPIESKVSLFLDQSCYNLFSRHKSHLFVALMLILVFSVRCECDI